MGSTPDSSKLRILVAGGGIGGLSAAIALRRQGHEVEVFEKSRLHSELGAAVYVSPNFTVALSYIDTDPENFRGTLYRGYKFLDSNLGVQDQMTFTDEQRAKWPARWWLVSRVDLHNALKEKATSPEGPGKPVKIYTGLGADSVDCGTASMTLADGTTVTGDLVVCADGIHSKTRRSVVGHDVPLISSGQACYRWLMSSAQLRKDPATRVFVDDPGHFIQVAGSDRRVILYPCANGEVLNCAALLPRNKVGEIKKGLTGYDQSANKQQLLGQFKDFSAPVVRLLNMAPDDNVKLWDLLDMELQPSLIRGRAVLIGDAAHPFLPHLGQGAAQAVEDACALGAVLPPGTPAEEIPQRLELWQKCRKDRAQKIVEDTRNRAIHIAGRYDLPQNKKNFTESMQYCITHDAWKHAEQQLKVWKEQQT